MSDLRTALDNLGFRVACDGGSRQLEEQDLAAVREAMAQAWDDALVHVWELSDPAYTIVGGTQASKLLVTKADIDQARHENPYRVSRPVAETCSCASGRGVRDCLQHRDDPRYRPAVEGGGDV